MSLLELAISASAAELAHGINIEGLFAEAAKALERAYAPYSRFRVGAALLTESGEIITGANVENSSYGLTICAERSAVVRAVAQGESQFVAIAIAGDVDRAHRVAPCGACLQVLAEFDSDETLLVIFPEGNLLRVCRVAELLPVRFRLEAD
jgi:cytidine deaminase